MKSKLIIIAASLGISALVFYNIKTNTQNTSNTVETVETMVVKDTTNTTKEYADSIFAIADNLVNHIYMEQTSMDDKIYTQELTIEEKAAQLNKAIKEVDKSHKDLAQAIAKTEIAEKTALKAKIEFEAQIIKLRGTQKHTANLNKALENERILLVIEKDKLKRECQRLNNLLGNDYSIHEIDSIAILPDSLKVNKKRNKRNR